MVTWDYWNSTGTSATTTGTWYYWSGNTTSTSSTTYTTTGDATWRYWGTTDKYEVKIVDSSITWSEWNLEYVKVSDEEEGPTVIIVKETAEQKRARLAQMSINAEWRLIENAEREEERKERQKRLDEERKIAEDNAQALLLDIIGEDQLKVYKRTGRVLVQGNKYQWLVTKNGKVQRITKTNVVDLCVAMQSRYSYPDTDNVIAMILAAKLDEEKFIKTANTVTRGSMNNTTKALMKEAANF